jgi:hypothetical protein
LPFDSWSGFCYIELGWTPKEFWSSTVWDVVSALIYFNKKNNPNKEKIDKNQLIDFEKNMRIKGLM